MSAGRGHHEDVHDDQRLNDLRSIFSTFDQNRDGHITLEELRSVLQILGQSIEDIELLEAIKQLDTNGNGTIEFEEFVSLMIQATTAIEYDTEYLMEEQIRKAFHAIDQDQNGRLSRKELFNLMECLGEMPSDEEIESMMSQADLDGDGYIDYDEFRKVVTQGV